MDNGTALSCEAAKLLRCAYSHVSAALSVIYHVRCPRELPVQRCVHVNATASQVYQIIISLIPCISALAHRILSARMKHGEARHVIVYDGDDEAYLNWLSEHPEGFVLNAKRTGTDGACSIHRATCGHILVMRNQATVGGFTQRGGGREPPVLLHRGQL